MKSLLTAAFGKMILGTCLLLSVATVHAQSTSAATSATAPGATIAGPNEQATVKYLGVQDDMILFNVSYANPDGSKFLLTVKDQDATQLYQSVFSEKAFYKQFRLPRADKDKIVFVIRNGKDADIVKTFEININSHIVQEVAVRKL